MSDAEDALIYVGKSCDCGFPLVWRNGIQRCAVYGSHPAPAERVTFWNQAASHAALVKAVMDCPNMARGAVRHRRLRALAKAAA